MKTITVDWDGQKVNLTWLAKYQLQNQDIITSVHAICIQNDKVLLTKINNRGFNYPGGHIENGETPEESLHREVYEEAYVKGDIHYLGVIEVNHKENPNFDSNGNYPIVEYQAFYRMDIKTCDSFLRGNEAITRIWVEPSEIPFVMDDHEIASIILKEALSDKTEQQKMNGIKNDITNHEELKLMLDGLLRDSEIFWNEFYSNRERNIPFFENKPDENLVSYFKLGILNNGSALELGCGPGRNAIFLAENGYKVDAVDLSEQSIKWATERAMERNLEINFINQNIFKLNVEDAKYDLIYDSGCFHHIAPHRRMDYIHLIKKSLKSGGYFAINCFIENGPLGGSDISDWGVYQVKSLQGGLGFTEDKLKRIFHDFECIDIRKMRKANENEPVFGIEGLLTAIFQKRAY